MRLTISNSLASSVRLRLKVDGRRTPLWLVSEKLWPARLGHGKIVDPACQACRVSLGGLFLQWLRPLWLRWARCCLPQLALLNGSRIAPPEFEWPTNVTASLAVLTQGVMTWRSQSSTRKDRPVINCAGLKDKNWKSFSDLNQVRACHGRILLCSKTIPLLP